jgi:hypothetical protein
MMKYTRMCLPALVLISWQAGRVLAEPGAAVQPVKIVIPVIPPLDPAPSHRAASYEAVAPVSPMAREATRTYEVAPPPPMPRTAAAPSASPTVLPAVMPLPATDFAAPGMLPAAGSIRQTGFAQQPEETPQVHTVPALPGPEPSPPDEERLSDEPATRWWTMRQLQGTWLGAAMDDSRLSFSGWTEASYNLSTTNVTNSPVVWADRSDKFLLQQHWMRFERSVVTDTNDPTWGFKFDTLIGSDYRFTIPRGFLNAQLQNSDGVTQNLYGVDLIQHYVNVYCPNLFKGTEFRVGRIWCPWGMESLEGPATPLPSRSYAFNWAPPFTHWGLGAYMTFNDQWSGMAMLVNGNDIYLGDPAEEMRYVGNLSCKVNAKNTVTAAVGLGRGMFNAGQPFDATTVSLPDEPLGRNNFNNVDVVWQHVFDAKWTYAVEGIYGWQYSAPDLFNPSGFGTATWGSACHYLFYQMTPKVQGILRYENFIDAVGQRTGFAGLYTSVTGGLKFNIRPGIIFRPELRFDYNGNSLPFEGKHGIVVADADLIVRW